MHDSTEDVGLQSQLRDLRMVAWRLCEAERSFYYHKAKCRYVVDTDRNTKLFHSVVKRNARRNQITSITRQDGSVTTSFEEVAHEFIQYFRSLLGTESHTQPVDLEVFSV